MSSDYIYYGTPEAWDERPLRDRADRIEKDERPLRAMADLYERIAPGRGLAQWVEQAACVGHWVDFFPRKEDYKQSVARAKALCARCPVYDRCDQWWRDDEQEPRVGVVAGKTVEERRAELGNADATM